MSSVLARIEMYHHDSNNVNDWSYGCPEFDLMGYESVNDLIKVINYLERRKQLNGNIS